MAKFKAEFEKGTPKYTLEFRGKEFSYSMVSSELGMVSDKACFSNQLAREFSDLDEQKLDNEFDVDMLSCYLNDEEELFEILENLEELE